MEITGVTSSPEPAHLTQLHRRISRQLKKGKHCVAAQKSLRRNIAKFGQVFATLSADYQCWQVSAAGTEKEKFQLQKNLSEKKNLYYEVHGKGRYVADLPSKERVYKCEGKLTSIESYMLPRKWRRVLEDQHGLSFQLAMAMH